MGGHAGLEMGICSWYDRMRARMVDTCTIYLKDSEHSPSPRDPLDYQGHLTF